MKHTKKILSVLLVVLMCMTMLPLTVASAADTECEHPDNRMETYACGAKRCNKCTTYFYHDTDNHVWTATIAGMPGTKNVCRYCYYFDESTAVDLKVGSNSITVDNYKAIRYIPTESGTRTVKLVSEDIRAVKNIALNQGYQNNRVAAKDCTDASQECSLTYNFTAGEVYLFIFSLTFPYGVTNYNATVTISCVDGSHTKTDSTVQTCKGYKCTTCGEYFGEKSSHTKTDSTVQTCQGYKCTTCGEYFGEKGSTHDVIGNVCQLCNEYCGKRDLYVGENKITRDDLSPRYYDVCVRFIPKLAGEYTFSCDMNGKDEVWQLVDAFGDFLESGSSEDVTSTLAAGTVYYFMFYSDSGKADFTFTITAPVHEHAYGTTVTCKGKQCSVCGGYDGTTGGNHIKADDATQTCLGYLCTVCGEYFGEKGTTHSLVIATCGGSKCTVCKTYIDNANTKHTDGEEGYLDNLCDACGKYVGTKDLVAGTNSIDADDLTTYYPKVIRFVPATSGTYTIDSDMTYADNEMWYIVDVEEMSIIAQNASDDEAVSFAFTAGEEYYFAFQSGSSKTDFTLTITAPAHTHVYGTTVTCKGKKCSVCGVYDGTTGGNHVKADNATQTCLGYLCTVCREYFGEKGNLHSVVGNFCQLCDEYCGKKDLYVGANKITRDDVSGSYYNTYIRFISKLAGEYTFDNDWDGMWILYDAGLNVLRPGYSEEKTFTLAADTVYYFALCANSTKTDLTFTITAPAHTHVYGTTVTCKGKQCSVCGGYDGTTGGNHVKADNATQTCLGYLCTVCGEYFGEKGTTHSLVTATCGGSKCTVCKTCIDNTNTKHTDGGDFVNNICDACGKYIGTKDLVAGTNSIDADDLSLNRINAIRFIPATSGTYTIGSDMTYDDQETWFTIADIDKLLIIAWNTSNDEDVSVDLTAGEAYYFMFQSGSSKTDFTFTITAPAHTHVFTDVAYKAASCIEAGNEAYKYCAGCKKYFAATADTNATGGADTNEAFKITKLEHSYTGALKSNGDTKDGTHSSKCIKGCNGYGNETSHVWDNGKVTTPATHLKEGVKTFTCVCGATYTEPVDKLTDHEWDNGKVTTPATHLKEGVKTYTCPCGETKTEPVAKLTDHEWDNGKVTTNATHLKEGVMTYTCPCGETKTEPISKLTDHEWDNGKVTTNATHLKEGVKTYTCPCGETKTEPIAKIAEHSYVDNVVAPSCTEQGYTEHICACGDKYVDSYVDASGHNYENGTCTECGDVDPDYNGGDNDNDNSDCDCICHNSNKFVQFIYKIVRWFWKLFNIRKTCDCGVVHY